MIPSIISYWKHLNPYPGGIQSYITVSSGGYFPPVTQPDRYCTNRIQKYYGMVSPNINSLGSTYISLIFSTYRIPNPIPSNTVQEPNGTTEDTIENYNF